MSQKKIAFRTFFLLVGAIFFAEAFVMLLLHEWAHGLEPWLEGILDAGILSVFVTPPIWFWVVRPLSKNEEALWREQTAILSASADGIVIIDGAGRIREFNAAAEAMFGHKHDDVLGLNVATVMGSSRQRAEVGETRDVHEQAVGLRRDGTSFPVDLSVGECRIKGAFRSVWVIRDITARKALEDERNRAFEQVSQHMAKLEAAQWLLRAANHRFAQLFEGLPIPCLTFDHDGIVFEVNQEFCRFYGQEAHEVLYRPIWESIRKREDEPETRDTISRLFAGDGVRNVERTDVARDGSEKQVLVSMLPLLGPQNDICGGIRASVDITQLKRLEDDLRTQLKEVVQAHLELERANRQLEALATTDVMTGLKNHRFFQESLRGACETHGRTGRPVSLIMLDVDHFKKFNDSYGHQAGDQVLASVGRILNDGARPSDTAARYGGEEFALILPDTDREAAMQVAERLRQEFASAEWTHREVTASFGVATSSEGSADAELLVSQADQALYASKANGRNQCTHHDDTCKRQNRAA